MYTVKAVRSSKHKQRKPYKKRYIYTTNYDRFKNDTCKDAPIDLNDEVKRFYYEGNLDLDKLYDHSTSAITLFNVDDDLDIITIPPDINVHRYMYAYPGTVCYDSQYDSNQKYKTISKLYNLNNCSTINDYVDLLRPQIKSMHLYHSLTDFWHFINMVIHKLNLNLDYRDYKQIDIDDIIKYVDKLRLSK